jgi:hypothetical protein|tara:strand:+ start:1997 stop:2398 length:402 start_codon:yes stop_codon:yes gene_type:complete
MIELIVLVVPIVSVLLGAYRKLFNSEKSAIEYIDFRNKYGAKLQMLKAPQVFLTSLCFIISPLFISTGILWSVLGGILLLGNVTFLLLHDGQLTIPDLCSNEFEVFITKRKKEALYGSIIICLWIISWLNEWI